MSDQIAQQLIIEISKLNRVNWETIIISALTTILSAYIAWRISRRETENSKEIFLNQISYDRKILSYEIFKDNKDKVVSDIQNIIEKVDFINRKIDEGNFQN